jgi:hypothetical protein
MYNGCIREARCKQSTEQIGFKTVEPVQGYWIRTAIAALDHRASRTDTNVTFKMLCAKVAGKKFAPAIFGA